MLAFTDQELAMIMADAAALPVERRAEFLELIAKQLKVRDIDIADASERARRYLQQHYGQL
jgi:hypothetical protein